MENQSKPQAIVLGDLIILQVAGLSRGQMRKLATAFVAVATAEEPEKQQNQSLKSL